MNVPVVVVVVAAAAGLSCVSLSDPSTQMYDECDRHDVPAAFFVHFYRWLVSNDLEESELFFVRTELRYIPTLNACAQCTIGKHCQLSVWCLCGCLR
jgi:hypothetical protein